jgi:hypothetical protein
MSDSYLAGLLNRPDLSVVTGPLTDPYGGSSGGMASTLPGVVYTGTDTALGQVHLGVLALITVGLVGFYVWTRSHQK